MHTTKIATCCYCGTRAALVLDAGRHELVCSSCGAPLHEMKALPQKNKAEFPVQSASRLTQAQIGQKEKPRESYRGKKKECKKKKSNWPWRKTIRKRFSSKKILEKIWDTVEDVFD